MRLEQFPLLLEEFQPLVHLLFDLAERMRKGVFTEKPLAGKSITLTAGSQSVRLATLYDTSRDAPSSMSSTYTVPDRHGRLGNADRLIENRYRGGLTDRVLMSINDTFIVIPLFPLLILFYFVMRDYMNWALLAIVIT